MLTIAKDKEEFWHFQNRIWSRASLETDAIVRAGPRLNNFPGIQCQFIEELEASRPCSALEFWDIQNGDFLTLNFSFLRAFHSREWYL